MHVPHIKGAFLAAFRGLNVPNRWNGMSLDATGVPPVLSVGLTARFPHADEPVDFTGAECIIAVSFFVRTRH